MKLFKCAEKGTDSQLNETFQMHKEKYRQSA